MSPTVVDASVLAAICFGEPGGEQWADRLEGVPVFAPTLLRHELISVARKKSQTHPDQAPAIRRALVRVLDGSHGIRWRDPDPIDVLLTAQATGLTTYDATYLCLAGLLAGELLTADRALASALT